MNINLPNIKFYLMNLNLKTTIATPLLAALLLVPGTILANGDDDHAHDDEAVVSVSAQDQVSFQESTAYQSLFGNRLIYLVVSLALIVLLTWGVFKLVKIKKAPNLPPTK